MNSVFNSELPSEASIQIRVSQAIQAWCEKNSISVVPIQSPSQRKQAVEKCSANSEPSDGLGKAPYDLLQIFEAAPPLLLEVKRTRKTRDSLVIDYFNPKQDALLKALENNGMLVYYCLPLEDIPENLFNCSHKWTDFFYLIPPSGSENQYRLTDFLDDLKNGDKKSNLKNGIYTWLLSIDPDILFALNDKEIDFEIETGHLFPNVYTLSDSRLLYLDNVVSVLQVGYEILHDPNLENVIGFDKEIYKEIKASVLNELSAEHPISIEKIVESINLNKPDDISPSFG